MSITLFTHWKTEVVTPVDATVYNVVEKMPEYPGGILELASDVMEYRDILYDTLYPGQPVVFLSARKVCFIHRARKRTNNGYCIYMLTSVFLKKGFWNLLNHASLDIGRKLEKESKGQNNITFFFLILQRGFYKVMWRLACIQIQKKGQRLDPTFINLKSNTMKNLMQRYCLFLNQQEMIPVFYVL